MYTYVNTYDEHSQKTGQNALLKAEVLKLLGCVASSEHIGDRIPYL